MSGYSHNDPIDFVGLAQALLDRAHTLVPQWLPKGFERAGRWYCGDFDGGEGESANVNLKTGQWIDNGGTDDDRGGDLISLYARIRGINMGLAGP
jgi:putative DNA primase/helicase